jgi:hypothetical protein
VGPNLIQKWNQASFPLAIAEFARMQTIGQRSAPRLHIDRA